MERSGTLTALSKFLNFGPALLNHNSELIPRKQTLDDLSLMLLNFQEVRGRYAGTTYEAMFDEVLVS